MNEKIINNINKTIKFNLFDDAKHFSGIFLIVPDILDSPDNYFEFSKFLNKNNYLSAVVHINTSQFETEKHTEFDPFKDSINDILGVVKYLQDKYPNKEIVLLGQGFGSYLVTRYLEISGSDYKAILSGTGYQYLPHLKFSKQVLLLIQTFRLKPNKGDIIKSFIFKKLAIKYENGNWISNDLDFFEQYKNSENFTRVLDFEFYYSYLNNILVKDKNIKNINNKSKILLLWGENDPILKTKNLVETIVNKFSSFGVNTSFKTFNDMLHNIFNEVDKVKVFTTALNFANTDKK